MSANHRSDLIDIACTIVAETSLAWKIDHGGDEDVWIPKSICEFDEGILTLPEWLAMEKGLI